MRGNEPNMSDMMGALCGEFQIPMRGNEIDMDMNDIQPTVVPNPHEG